MSAIHQVLASLHGATGGTDPNFANVQLLMHMDGSNGGTVFTDNSAAARAFTRTGTPTTVTATKKFGTAAMQNATELHNVQTTSLSGLTFGTGDFTVECQLYPTDINSWGRMAGADGSHSGRWFLAQFPGTSDVYVDFNGAADFSTSSAPLTINAWNHVEWSRASGTSRIFVNGTSVYSGADTNSYQIGSTALLVGGGISTSATQYIDEVRITVGVARHTANFTAPIAAFPDS